MLKAQQFEGSMSGYVKDASGTIDRDADIIVTNLQTSVVYHSKTNSAGEYSILLLPIGKYELKVHVDGFNTYINKFEVHGGDHLRGDITLHVASTTETVSVQSSDSQLEVNSGDTGMTITEVQAHDLPTFSRNPITLTELVPGVIQKPGTTQVNALRPFDNGGFDQISINGGLTFTTEVSLDGLTDTGSEQGSYTQVDNILILPSPEMLQEMRIQTSVYDAQYGRSGGGVISMNLKSGTNQFHGVLGDYVRNSMFNANDYASNYNKKKKAGYHWSQPGGVVTGPVIIPHLYDGRDKTFFMFGWEDVRSSVPNPVYTTVPTMLERAGDFSQSLSGSMPATIYDPTTTLAVGNGKYSRGTFAGSKIPQQRINPIAAKIMALIPEPNISQTIAASNNLFAGNNNDRDKYDEFVTHVDHSVNANHRLAFAYLQSQRNEYRYSGGLADGWPIAIAPDYGHARVNHAAHGNWSWTIKNNLLSTFGIGWNEHKFVQAPIVGNYDLSTLGFPAYVGSSSAKGVFPYISVSGYTSFGNLNSGIGSGKYYTSSTYDFRETLFWTAKHHIVSVGAELRPVRENVDVQKGNFALSFSKAFTQADPLNSDAVSGNAYASFLLGYPSGGSVASNPPWEDKMSYLAAFLQDSWRVTDKLTVTLGMRWDTDSPQTNAYQNVGFDENARYYFANTAMQGVVQFRDGGVRNQPYNWDVNNFGPRVGFAYEITPSLVMRGGAGILYLPTFDVGSQIGYSGTSSYDASDDGGITLSKSSLSDPFPDGFTAAKGSSTNLNGQGGWVYWKGGVRQIPRNTQYSLGFEWKIPHISDSLLDVHYVGTYTDSLYDLRNRNFTSIADLAKGSQLATAVTNPLQGYVPGTSLNAATISLQQSLLPFPQYTSFSYQDSNRRASYNGLQVRFDKRLTHGLHILTSYTWSKSLTTGYLNDQDTVLTKYLNNANTPQYLTVAAGYQLPFFAHNAKRAVRQIGSGWTVSSGRSQAFSTGLLEASNQRGLVLVLLIQRRSTFLTPARLPLRADARIAVMRRPRRGTSRLRIPSID
jgi:hypothetical protein